MLEMTPRQIVEMLDKYIIGQAAAKRSVAIAVRNRWRRQRVEPEMRKEIGPKNMLMIGPTGVGKTEIARRLAKLTGAPFIKVEATKYTEVGYYGRDVESIVRDLVENAIGIVRAQERVKVADHAEEATTDQLVDLLAAKFESEARDAGPDSSDDEHDGCDGHDGHDGCDSCSGSSGRNDNNGLPDFLSPDKIRSLMAGLESNQGFQDFMKNFAAAAFKAGGVSVKSDNDNNGGNDNNNDGGDNGGGDKNEGNGNDSGDGSTSGDLAESAKKPRIEETRVVDRDEIRRGLVRGDYEDEIVSIHIEQKNSPMMIGVGSDMESDLQSMLENIMPKRTVHRRLPVREARKILYDQECDLLINKEKMNAQAIELAENLGIVFIDEIDKIVASERTGGADVSRQGVQRDLLPIVEGTTVQTKYGLVSTEHVLFIAAGAFHRSKPTDLMPELQGRFPIRVELSELSREDFNRILTEPEGSLVKQYTALLKTEGVKLVFTPDAIDALAEYAFEVNQTSQNIGARRLYTIMERLLEELSFEAPEIHLDVVTINAKYVADRLQEVVHDEDLNKYIL